MKVLIAIGTLQDKKFTRLFKIIDELCEEKILDGKEVLAQVGYDNYQTNYYETFNMMSDEEFKGKIKWADLIIAHAGTGTIISCIKQEKKVIIFPRKSEYDEHYDDHQLELAELFSESGYALSATNKEELIQCIQTIDEFQPRKFISSNGNIGKVIQEFLLT